MFLPIFAQTKQKFALLNFRRENVLGNS